MVQPTALRGKSTVGTVIRTATLAAAFLMRAVASAAQQPEAAPLAVTGSWPAAQWIRGDQRIELRLTRPPAAGEGRVAILIGPTDWTGLFVEDRSTFHYTPASVRLPSGEQEVVVSLVAATGEWREIGRLPLRVVTARGFERASATPRLELGLRGQVAQSQTPPSGVPARERFQDLTVTAGLQSESVRSGWTTRTSLNVVGVSLHEEALRFGQLGEQAPSIDLADYILELGNGRTKLALGHVTQGTHRFLFNAQNCSSASPGFRCAPSFASRGATALLALGPFADLALAAVNGSPIVGWSNIAGVESSDHRIRSATLGVEARPARPGAFRLEASILDGSLQPVAGFAQGVVNDAETSRGIGVRVGASDAQGRFWLDAGFARSRFQNPTDPLLDRTLPIVAVREEEKDARYLDASYALIHNKRVGKTATASVVVGYRHERADPLYRSVAAPTARADILQNVVEATANIGSFSARLATARSHDNLDGIASILETQTDMTVLETMLPLATLGRDPSRPQAALPTITYQLSRTHQFGVSIPVDGGFDEPSKIPDQLSTNQAIGVEWQHAKWRAGYRFNRSFQDNRQVGRALADLANLTNNVTLGVMPHAAFDLTTEIAFEGAENFEISRVDVTRRLGVAGNWRPAARTAIAALVALTWTRDQAETNENRSTDANLQISQNVALWPAKRDRLQGQVFIRFSRRSAAAINQSAGLNDQSRAWSLSTGLNLRVF
ncbi:MAG: hypothetical protein WD690_09495 [Vicinamibacterales bacterium]